MTTKLYKTTMSAIRLYPYRSPTKYKSVQTYQNDAANCLSRLFFKKQINNILMREIALNQYNYMATPYCTEI